MSSLLPSSDVQPISTPPPPVSFLTGTWYVNYSTLPMWKDKRNVRITYTVLPFTNPSLPDPVLRLDDLVEYQALNSDKIKAIHGIDTASGADTGAWDWRGKGWLKIASSHWEFVDWGLDGAGGIVEGETEGHGKGIEEEWAVIWFQKTLFTPEGIDIFSRRKEGLREETVKAVKEKLGGGRHKTMSEGLFEVRRE
ncbi:hypothetical protein G7Y79_00008g024170 [Physcia stellaris]|nr:hypothetical protein G7Y79_00008g024170 [Physcia stellaris]